jgi:hypothetical protein
MMGKGTSRHNQNKPMDCSGKSSAKMPGIGTKKHTSNAIPKVGGKPKSSASMMGKGIKDHRANKTRPC